MKARMKAELTIERSQFFVGSLRSMICHGPAPAGRNKRQLPYFGESKLHQRQKFTVALRT